MTSSTGNRCAIYEKIDALDESRTVADLIKRLKPILNELAYYAVTGEAAVMETREEWHTQYADVLYNETASDHNADRAATQRPGLGRSAMPRPDHETLVRARGQKSAGDRRQAQAAPPANRPRPSNIPSSLQAIMNGSHASFKEEDR